MLLNFLEPSCSLLTLITDSGTPSNLVSRVRRVRSILNENYPWRQLYIRVRRVSSVRSVIN